MKLWQSGLIIESISGISYSVGRVFSKLFYHTLKNSGYTIKDKDTNGRWDAYKDSGTNGSSVDGYQARFNITGDTYNFTSSDVDRYLTITGFTSPFTSRNGTWRILKVVSSKVVVLDIQRGVHSAGLPYPTTGLSWELWAADTSDCPTTDDWFVYTGTGINQGGYDFDVKVRVTDTANDPGTDDLSSFPVFQVGPHGNWNATSHSWDDTRYTPEFNWGSQNTAGTQFFGSVSSASVFMVVDTDNLMISVRPDILSYSTSDGWCHCYIGEIDTDFSSSLYSRPVIICGGTQGRIANNSAAVGPTADVDAVSGTGFCQGVYKLTNIDTSYHRGKLYVIGRAPGPYDLDGEYITSGWNRRRDPYTDEVYHQVIAVGDLSDDDEYGEIVGYFKKVVYSSALPYNGIVYGTNSEFCHVSGGLTYDWHGGNVEEYRF